MRLADVDVEDAAADHLSHGPQSTLGSVSQPHRSLRARDRLRRRPGTRARSRWRPPSSRLIHEQRPRPRRSSTSAARPSPGLPGKGIVDLSIETEPGRHPGRRRDALRPRLRSPAGPRSVAADAADARSARWTSTARRSGSTSTSSRHGGDYARDLAFRDALRADPELTAPVRRPEARHHRRRDPVEGLRYTYSKTAWILGGLPAPRVRAAADRAARDDRHPRRRPARPDAGARRPRAGLSDRRPRPRSRAARRPRVADRSRWSARTTTSTPRCGWPSAARSSRTSSSTSAGRRRRARRRRARSGPGRTRSSSPRTGSPSAASSRPAGSRSRRGARSRTADDLLERPPPSSAARCGSRRRRGGYDGRSQVRVGDVGELDGAIERLGRPAGEPLLARARARLRGRAVGRRRARRRRPRPRRSRSRATATTRGILVESVGAGARSRPRSPSVPPTIARSGWPRRWAWSAR